jgi:hypothetical protein
VTVAACRACGAQFFRRGSRRYCDECRNKRRREAQEASPAVYCFVCPDGRSYVGSTRRVKIRARDGVQRWGYRPSAALLKYPSEEGRFEVLEWLPQDCSDRELHEAEQHHIDRLKTFDPKRGFNVLHAVTRKPLKSGIHQIDYTEWLATVREKWTEESSRKAAADCLQ